MICTMRCCRWIIDSLRSIRCEERSSSRIPPDPNETSVSARYTPTQYFSDSIFKLRIVNKIKGKATNALFKKLRLVI
jgi:hypothetical protein